MIATIRKLDCCGREIWRTTSSHGADLSIDFDTESDARECVIAACQRAKAWPLTIDTVRTPGTVPEGEILSGPDMTIPFRNIIALAADSYAQLRRSDVFRVMDAANNVDSLLGFAATLISQRPDLRSEVEECVEELATPSFALANDAPKHKPSTFAAQDKTLQKVLVDGMDCLPGQLDLF